MNGEHEEKQHPRLEGPVQEYLDPSGDRYRARRRWEERHLDILQAILDIPHHLICHEMTAFCSS